MSFVMREDWNVSQWLGSEVSTRVTIENMTHMEGKTFRIDNLGIEDTVYRFDVIIPEHPSKGLYIELPFDEDAGDWRSEYVSYCFEFPREFLEEAALTAAMLFHPYD